MTSNSLNHLNITGDIVRCIAEFLSPKDAYNAGCLQLSILWHEQFWLHLMSQPSFPTKAIDWALKNDVPGLIERFIAESRVDPSADRSLLFRRACRRNAIKIVAFLFEWDKDSKERNGNSKYSIDLFERYSESFFVVGKHQSLPLLRLLFREAQERNELDRLLPSACELVHQVAYTLNVQNLQFLIDLFRSQTRLNFVACVAGLNSRAKVIRNKPEFRDTMLVLLGAVAAAQAEQLEEPDASELLKAASVVYPLGRSDIISIVERAPTLQQQLPQEVRKLVSSIIQSNDIELASLLLHRKVFELLSDRKETIFCEACLQGRLEMMQLLHAKYNFPSSAIDDKIFYQILRTSDRLDIVSFLFRTLDAASSFGYMYLTNATSDEVAKALFESYDASGPIISPRFFCEVIEQIVASAGWNAYRVLLFMLRNPQFDPTLMSCRSLDYLVQNHTFLTLMVYTKEYNILLSKLSDSQLSLVFEKSCSMACAYHCPTRLIDSLLNTQRISMDVVKFARDKFVENFYIVPGTCIELQQLLDKWAGPRTVVPDKEKPQSFLKSPLPRFVPSFR